MIRTTATFKCVVTLANGFHKIVRMSIDKVAKMRAALRQLKESPWLTKRYVDFFREMEISATEVMGCKFINESTGEVLIEI